MPSKKRYDMLIQKGLCTKCGSKPQYEEQLKCFECIEKNAKVELADFDIFANVETELDKAMAEADKDLALEV